MDTLSKPVVFTITEAGKQAALIANADSALIKINIKEVAIGDGKYLPTGKELALKKEIKRSSIVSGGVEIDSNTLRFSSTITDKNITPVYEIGLFTDDNLLFAIAASNTDPLFTVHPDISFVGAFGLSLDGVSAERVTVTTNSDGAMAVAIMQQHLASRDPHPQYLNQKRFLQFLEIAYPYGYKHWTTSAESPEPLFTAMFGYRTFWRRLEGVQLVSVRDGDPVIGDYGLVAGNGGLDKTDNDSPNNFTHYTGYLWERYDPDAPIRHNAISRRNGIHKFK